MPLMPSPGKPNTRRTPHAASRCNKKSLTFMTMLLPPARAGSVSVGRERDRAQERVGRLPGVQTRMLHDERDVRLDERRVIRPLRNRLRLDELVEPEVLGATRGHGDPVRSDRLTIGEEHEY